MSRLARVAWLAVAAPGAPSAHGGAVVFTSSYGVFVANADGSALTRLTSSEFDESPVWSPDGKTIALGRMEESGSYDFYVAVVKPDGSKLRRLGTAEGTSPAWSPDGRTIAFSGTGRTPAPVYLVNADGTGTRVVIANADRTGGFTWSPDGKRIAFSDGGQPARIKIVDVAGGAMTTLGTSSFERATNLVWSPDGKQIAFQADGLRVITVASGAVTKLADVDDDLAIPAAWSPDSTRIAFVREGKELENSALFTIGRDGRGERSLRTVGHSSDGALSWAADGSFIVYSSTRFPGSWRENDIWRIRPDGTGATPITHAFPTGADFDSADWAATTIPSPRMKPMSMVALRPSASLTARGFVDDLSADGTRAAVSDSSAVDVWTVGGDTKKFESESDCGGVRDLTLAGPRVAWDYGCVSNTVDETHYVFGTLASGSVREIVFDYYKDAPWNGNLAGDGGLLVYNTWEAKDSDSPATEQKLWQVVGEQRASSRVLLAGPDALDVAAVDAGRIAVLRPDDLFVVLDARGKRQSAFRLSPKDIEAVRLTGSQLVLLRGMTIEVRNATTGAIGHRWPVAKSDAPVTLEDAQGDFAVYTAGIAIHLLRLSDGRDRVLAIANQGDPAHADLEPSGLYYSYNETGSAKPGRVRFVPPSRVAAAFR